MDCLIKSIAIIGYGKFGQLAYSQLKELLPTTRLAIYSEPPVNANADLEVLEFKQLDEFDLIILAMPISAIEATAKRLANELSTPKTVIDICSVKLYPRQILEKELPKDWQIICSHPLFGPASFKANSSSLSNLVVTLENVRCSSELYGNIKKFLELQELKVLEISAEDHDRYFAAPQFLTHFAAALFKTELQPVDNEAPSQGIRSVDLLRTSLSLLTADQALLKDIYQYNPYAKDALKKVQIAWAATLKSLE